jgi:hypothetical protein
MPKVDGSLSSSVEPQFGHDTVDVAENTSRSKRSPQLTHSNSNTGTWTLLCQAQPTIYPRSCVLDSASVPLHDSLSAILAAPTPEALWRLRADLLEMRHPADSEVWPLLGDFHEYLEKLATTTSSRDFSHLASKLDISAISGVILERIAERGEASERALRLLSGLLSEGLMALATRQHVKAWSAELDAVYRSAAWRLYERLWRWTESRTPKLSPDRRRRLIDSLIFPVNPDMTGGTERAVLVGRLFQILLLWTLAEETDCIDLFGVADRSTDAGHNR